MYMIILRRVTVGDVEGTYGEGFTNRQLSFGYYRGPHTLAGWPETIHEY